jgi:lipid-binding SYLF domain-containing protein
MTKFFFLIGAGGLSAMAADDATARLDRAAAVFTKLTTAPHGIRPEQINSADCIAVVPGFKKGAAVVGVGFGRGFISCRTDDGWSAPGAIAFETGSVGVQLGVEEIDIVILSMDKSRRAKLLSDRFAVGSDAAAAWGNGKTAHGDPNAQILFFGSTKGAFAGFGLDGSTIKWDESADKALYGKPITNTAIVNGATPPPAPRSSRSRLVAISISSAAGVLWARTERRLRPRAI